jgi:LPPG:FO 2-phospho-L-lactate transferase
MKIAMLSGGVGGARFARGLSALDVETTVVVNVADDLEVYGVTVCPDIDTVLYTLAGVEGPEGWGRAGDTWSLMETLSEWGEDVSFRVGDRDMAMCLYRTERLRSGFPLCEVTAQAAAALGVRTEVVPATDDRLRTWVRTEVGWMDFQTYFVRRGHRDRVSEIRFEGSEIAGVCTRASEALRRADLIVIGPSNPLVSIHPILAVRGVRELVEGRRPVVAVSPLKRGRAFRGPAADLLASLGHPPGIAGVLAAYQGLVTHLVVDPEEPDVDADGVELLRTDIDIRSPERARRLAWEILEWVS